jgi:RimJ/RimL family protein N-acetyltransferase
MNQELIEFVKDNEKDILSHFPEFENFIQEIGFENANFDPILIDGPKRVIGFFQGTEILYGKELMTLISFLYIAPSHRGKGFARSTIKWLQDHTDSGVLTFANNRSYNVFKSLGFKKTERITKMVWKNEQD